MSSNGNFIFMSILLGSNIFLGYFIKSPTYLTTANMGILIAPYLISVILGFYFIYVANKYDELKKIKEKKR